MSGAVDGARARHLRWWAMGTIAVVPPVSYWALRSAFGDDARLVLDARLLYLANWVVVALGAIALAWNCRERPAPCLRRSLPGILGAIALTAAVFWAVPPRMRVQFDESCLVNTSISMHERGSAAMVTSAVPRLGDLVPLQTLVDKRPPLFPFLVSLVHDVGGARPANAFVVNAVALAVALFLAFAFVRQIAGPVAALAAQFLLLAVPMTTVFATCAGFDLLATVLLGATLLAARSFVAQPDARRFVTFVAVAGGHASTRYESILAVALAAAVVAWRVRGRWSPGRVERFTIVAIPSLVMPVALSLLAFRDPRFLVEAGELPLFGWSHLFANSASLLRGWFVPSLTTATPGIVAILAVGAFVSWIVRRRRLPADVSLLIPVLGLTALVASCFGSDIENATALRLFLPLAFVTALTPLLLIGAFGPRVAPWLLGTAAVLAIVRVDAVRRGGAFPELDGERLTVMVDEELDRPEFEARETLWVTTIAQHLVTTGRAALPPAVFLRCREDVAGWVATGSVRAVFLLETPYDTALAREFGAPREVLAVAPHRLVVHTGGRAPLTIHRLQ